MKCSTMMASLCCGALALAVTGCKYDNVSDDGVADGGTQEVVSDVTDDSSMNANSTDISTDENANAAANADEMDLSAATGLPFDQDPNYARCADVDFTPVYFGSTVSSSVPAPFLVKPPLLLAAISVAHE